MNTLTRPISLFAFILLSHVAIASTVPGAKCRGLALAGGGDHGAYQVGALNALGETLDPSDLVYDYVSGISVGSVNSSMFAVTAPGTEINTFQLMKEMWMSLDAADIYKKWPLGIAEGFLAKRGLFDTAPERAFLENTLKEYPSYQEREVFFGSSNLTEGKFQIFSNMDLDFEEFVNAIMSSSAAPGVFETQNWNDSTYSDGGELQKIDFWPIIESCREKGFADEDIVIDGIFCYHHQLPPLNLPKDFPAFSMFRRYLDIMLVERYNHYIALAHESYPKIDWRFLIMPSQTLPDAKIPLGFKHEDIVAMYQIGYDDALALLKEKNSSDKSRNDFVF